MTILAGRVTPSLRGALATKQPRLSRGKLWIASLSLAMTIRWVGLLRRCEERWRRSNPDCACGANLDCFAIARNEGPVGRVTPSLRGALATKQPRLRLRSKLWIASL